MTDDLVQWLHEQIAEDRRIANAAHDRTQKGAEQWAAAGDYGTEIRDASRDKNLVVKHSWVNEIAHIVRHDPRNVLVQCDAHEAILKVHNVWSVVYPGDTVDADPDGHCVGCGFDAMEEYRTEDVNNCPTLRALALAYRHRPGYREEWKP